MNFNNRSNDFHENDCNNNRRDCDCPTCPPGPQGPIGETGPAGGVLNYAPFRRYTACFCTSCDYADWLICNQQVEFDRQKARFLLGRAFAIVMTYLIILLLNSIFSQRGAVSVLDRGNLPFYRRTEPLHRSKRFARPLRYPVCPFDRLRYKFQTA